MFEKRKNKEKRKAKNTPALRSVVFFDLCNE